MAASGRVWASASGSFEKDRIGDDDVLASPQVPSYYYLLLFGYSLGA